MDVDFIKNNNSINLLNHTKNMCQCLCCNCWWWNYCGVCAGYAQLNCCWGYWCCKPEEMNRHNSACCYCCEQSGLGTHWFCYGSVCCAPAWLVNYSNQANGQGQYAPGMQQNKGGQNITIIQPGMQQQPMYGQPMQPMYGQPGYGQPYGQPGYVQGGPTIIKI